MGREAKLVGIVGRLGVRPLVKLSLPARRLIAYLALRGGEVTRQRAADELWPDLSEEQGRSNLRRSLWQTPSGWISSLGDQIVLHAECDLPAARRVAIRAIEGQPLTFDELDVLSEDLLPGWHDEWLLDAFEDFRAIRIQALEAACRTFFARENFALAIQAGSAALAADPLCESAAEALIEAHLGQRNRAAAVRCYQALVRRLEADLSIAPNEALEERMRLVGLGHRAA